MSSTIKQPSGLSELYFVTLHEIGHLLGIGSLWNYTITNPPITRIAMEDNGSVFNYYTGINALREYRSVFNDQALIGIPIEDNGSSGTVNVHLEEGTENTITTNDRFVNGKLHPGLDQELMTGWAESFDFDMPLSKITISLLEDLGYSVNYDQADSYANPKTPWTNSIPYYVIKNSTNNEILLDGNCFVDISLVYHINTSQYGGSGNLFYNDISNVVIDITDTIRDISTNTLFYTPIVDSYDVTFTISYSTSYYSSIINTDVFSRHIIDNHYC